MAREYDAVIQALDVLEDAVQRRYRGGLEQDQYMQNVGRHNMLDEVRDAVKKLKKRSGGDDDGDGSTQRPAGRGRRGVGTDDWEDTPGEPIDANPF